MEGSLFDRDAVDFSGAIGGTNNGREQRGTYGLSGESLDHDLGVRVDAQVLDGILVRPSDGRRGGE